MPRPNRGVECLIGGAPKIRKRGCSSSSSSSSVLQSYRFKRPIFAGKKGGGGGGSGTLLPTWKVSSRSPASMARPSESPKYPPSQAGSKANKAPVSARKLAATLWEMNEIPSPRVKEDWNERRVMKESRARDRVARSVQSGYLPPHLSDPSHSPASEGMDRSVTGSVRRRVSAITQRIRSSNHNGKGLDSVSNASFMEIETRSRGPTPAGSVVGVKSRLRDVSNGLATSKELLKVLHRIWGLEEQHSSSISLVQALRAELERARMQVDHLIEEQKSDKDEINYLMKRFAEEKTAWKIKEQEKIRVAIESISGDLEVEKRLRRRTETINLRLSRELTETKASLLEAAKELEGEKRTREILEHVCDELARGIGEDQSEVQKLKRESTKVREETENEKEMLQLADTRRGERIQIKLPGAKFQFEEKNTAANNLRNELDTFFNSRSVQETQKRSTNDRDAREDRREVDDGDGELDSAESDLHSIELNMDKDNIAKGYGWSYAQDGERRALVEGETKGKKYMSDKVMRALDRSLSEGIDWQVSLRNQGNAPEQGRLSQSSCVTEKQAKKEDYSYKSLKGLRDHILSSSRIGSAPGFASPTRQWARHDHLRDPVEQMREKLKVGEMAKGRREGTLISRLIDGKGGNPRQKHKPPKN